MGVIVEAKTARGAHAQLMREKRASDRDLRIPAVKNPTRRERALADPYSFLTTYFEDDFCNWSPSRRVMVDAIFEALRTKTAQAIAAPRRDGKTSITTGVVAYCILKGLVKYVVLVSATAPAAADLLENLKALFERCEALAEDFPEVSVPVRDVAVAPARAGGQTVNGESTFVEWTSDSVVFPTVADSTASGVVIKSCGIGSSIRGANRFFQRPDLVIIDDPDDEESAGSDAKTATRDRKIKQTIRGLAGEKSDVGRVMLCTLINRKCIAAKYTDRRVNPAWNGRRFKLIEKMPTCVGSEDDLWAKYVEMVKEDWSNDDRFARSAHAYYLENREAMDAGAAVGNSMRFYGETLEDGTQREVSTLQHAFNLVADIDWDAFLTEYQNDPPSNEEDSGAKLNEWVVRGSATGYSGRVNGCRRGELPAGSGEPVAFVDLGDNRLTWEVMTDIGHDRVAVVDYGRTETRDKATLGVKVAIFRALDETRDYFKSRNYNLASALIDSGSGVHTEIVYQWVRENGGVWYASKGDGNYSAPIVKQGNGRQTKNLNGWHPSPNIPRLILMDADAWKLKAHAGFLVKPFGEDGSAKDPVKGCVRLFGDDPRSHAEFAKEITAEEYRREFTPEKGVSEEWVQTSRANHHLDTHYGCLVALSLAKVLATARSRPVPKMGVLSTWRDTNS